MTFDDQLKRAFDTLSDRLRAEVDRQVAAVMDDLAGSARTERDRAADEAREAASRQASEALDAAVAEARDQAHAAGLTAGRHEGAREGLEEGRRQGIEEGRQEGILEGRQQGVAYGRQQAEEEGRQAIAAALAAAQSDRIPTAAHGSPERLVGAVGSIGRARSLSEILDELSASARREAAQAEVWLVRGGQLRRWRAADGDADVPLEDAGTTGDAVRSGTAVISGREVAVPIAMAGQVVAVLSASGSESTSANAAALDVLTRYAERCLETITAFKTARAVSERLGATGHGGHDAAMHEEDASARRYARLLVSEIKLYHEPAVVEGRRDRDLATRLGGEIARARVLYEERVPLQVRQRADYFHDELVRTLANGDATLLQIT